MDLMIDVEKGEIVSRASSSRNGTPVLPYQPNSDATRQIRVKTEEFGNVNSVLDTDLVGSQLYVRNAYSDHNFKLRPDRLKKLGFHFLDKNNLDSKSKESDTDQIPADILVQNANENVNLKAESTQQKTFKEPEKATSPTTLKGSVTSQTNRENKNKLAQTDCKTKSDADQTGVGYAGKGIRVFSNKIIVKPSEIEISLTNPNHYEETDKHMSRSRRVGDNKSANMAQKRQRFYQDNSIEKISTTSNKNKSNLLLTENKSFENDTLKESKELYDFEESRTPANNYTNTCSFTDYENEFDDGTMICSDLEFSDEEAFALFSNNALTVKKKLALPSQMILEKKKRKKPEITQKHTRMKSLSTKREQGITSAILPDYGIISDKLDKKNKPPRDNINSHHSNLNLNSDGEKLNNTHRFTSTENKFGKTSNASPGDSGVNKMSRQIHYQNGIFDFTEEMPCNSSQKSTFRPRSYLPPLPLDSVSPIPRTFSNSIDQTFTGKINNPVLKSHDADKERKEEPIYDEPFPIHGVKNPALCNNVGPNSGQNHPWLQR